MNAVIIKLGALGDVLMSTPIIKTLLAVHEKEGLTLLTSTQFAELFRDWPGLSVKHFPRSGFKAGLAAAFWLRSQHFDRIYDFQSNDRSRILCSLSGAKEKIGNHNYYPYTHHPGDRYRGQNHIFERHKQLLAGLGITLTENKPWLPQSARAKEKVDEWLRLHALNEAKLVLLHAGGSPRHPEKRWPHFPDIADNLAASGYKILWLGAEDDADINARMAKKQGVDASNAFSIEELVELGRRSKMAITNDSGPMHVLSCAGLPIFSLFGPTNWQRNHAIGQEAYVISLNKSNSVWLAEDYSDVDTDDLSLITAEMVWSVLLSKNYIMQ